MRTRPPVWVPSELLWLAVLCALFPLPYVKLGPDTASAVKEFLSTCLFLPVLYAYRDKLRFRDIRQLAVAFYFLLSLFSLTISANVFLGVRMLTLDATCVAALLVSASVKDGRTVREAALSSAASLLAVSVLVEGLLGGSVLSMPGRGPGGLLANRNHAAQLLALLTPFVASNSFVDAKFGFRKAALNAAILALTLAAILTTRCRSAWIALAVWIVASCLKNARFLKWRLCVRAAAIAAASLAIAGVCSRRIAWHSDRPLRDTISSLTDSTEGSGHARLVQNLTLGRMILSRPLLGFGPGNWAVRYPEYAPANDPTIEPTLHAPVDRLPGNSWLTIMAERGIPAAVLLAGLLAAWFTRAWARDRYQTWGAILIFVVIGLFDPITMRIEPILTLALVAGGIPLCAPSKEG